MTKIADTDFFRASDTNPSGTPTACSHADVFGCEEFRQLLGCSSNQDTPMSDEEALAAINGVGLAKYEQLLTFVFLTGFTKGVNILHFTPCDLETAAKSLGLRPPKNLSVVVSSFQRKETLPDLIARTAPTGTEWHIELMGDGHYVLVPHKICRICPDPEILPKRVMDRTRAICAAFDFTDKRLLELELRENGLLTDFLGHETTLVCQRPRQFVKSIGRTDIDVIYAADTDDNRTSVITVQIALTSGYVNGFNAANMMRYARLMHADSLCRALVVQRLKNGCIAIYEMETDFNIVKVIREAHYKLY